MNWIKIILGISELISNQEKTNDLLLRILEETKRNADLQQKFNAAHGIK